MAATVIHAHTQTTTTTDQVIEDVLLVDMNCDEGLIFGSLHLGQVLGGLVNEKVQHGQELLIGVGHDLLVRPGTGQCLLSITCPDHLDAQQTNLDSDNQDKI